MKSEADVYSVADFRKNLSQALDRAHYKSEVIEVSNYNKPYASLVSTKRGNLVKFLDSSESISEETLERLTNAIQQKRDGMSDAVSLGDILDHLIEDEGSDSSSIQNDYRGNNHNQNDHWKTATS
jgi:antitoxin (DNA-binding transcriptional repressor) of toxin-antitoxin stability system